MRNYKIKVKGDVQGVGYRYAAYQKANILGLKGTVKNLEDGSVEINAKGKDDSLDSFVKWCHQGPDTANVQDVNARETEEIEAFEFKIVR